MDPAATFFVAEPDLLARCLGPKVRPANPYFLLGVHAVSGGLAVRISGLKHTLKQAIGAEKKVAAGRHFLRKKVP